MMWTGMEGMGWGWIGLGVVHMVLFWALVIVVLVALVRWLAPGKRSLDEQTPLEILRARYAKGELTPEEFERMKRDLAEQ